MSHVGMSFQQWYVFEFSALFMIFGLANGICPQITVDQSGHGDFTTVQSAINSIPSINSMPSRNNSWVCVLVKRGVYREKVTIPYDKEFVMLKGEGKKVTLIVWDDHATLEQSPTFSVYAHNFKAKSISFVNSYNYPWSKNGNPRVPAVAALIGGDKNSFYRCGFYGVQDTLWDVQGRHYFQLCTIMGIVDFIFGSGQSIYERCSLSVVGNALDLGSPGFITAQGREDNDDDNGFVFKYCNIIGSGLSYLGRPWREYARVLFFKTTMSNIIEPSGWSPWNCIGREFQLTFAEYGCTGLGSNISQRVSWEKNLTVFEVEFLISMNFINSDGWLERQP